MESATAHDGACDYVPGAISLTVDGAELLGDGLWDDVNWLWPGIVGALEECRRSGSGTSWFPDQPIVFGAESLRRPGYLKVSVTTADRSIHRAAVAPSDAVYEAVARAGLTFFAALARLCGSSGASREEAELRRWLQGG